MPRIAINGFGRIGRAVFRQAVAQGLEIVAINDLTDAATLAHLLRFDSVHGRFEGTVEAGADHLIVDGRTIPVFAERDPASLPWEAHSVDLVLECTGRFRDREGASKHLAAGARRVLISAPGKDADVTLCYGVNHECFDPEKHRIVSNASCTTNCLATVAKVLHEHFGIRRGLMTTVHSYTNDQRILDLPHRDLRRARAAALSMIPTTTGAAKAVGLVLPELAGRLHGMAVRVPTPNVSLVDLTVEVSRSVTVEEINETFRAAAEGPMAHTLAYEEAPTVSVDHNNSRWSAVFDAASTTVLEGDLVKVLAWYDNEWGFSARMVDMARHIAR
ncbi:MAG: type I glyceraldehyde-3-phosphate dehydrogenase [Deltaproteobacteria bacterium]|nr:MAG: type I glyceraldehyde-3-phosphate dehydrogenase [Deltaproteobacteria bacterium]